MAQRHQLRSKNGCFTCRRRKKKCDESAYPNCKNCISNKLQCSWPDHVVSAHEEEKKDDNKTTDPAARVELSRDACPAKVEIQTLPENSFAADNRVIKPPKKGKNYILQRISMQQDCVEDFQEDFLGFLNPVGPVVPVVGVFNAAPISHIRDRIAHQLDIPGDEIKRTVLDKNVRSKN